MSFYERIDKQAVDTGDFGLTFGQACDISSGTQSNLDKIWIAFKFGFLQGQRHEQKKNKVK